jgi:DNA polymerase
MSGREKALAARHKLIRTCVSCELSKTRRSGVPGEGPLDPSVLLFGQSPGVEEDKSGRPFVGRSGRFLTGLIEGIGLRREEVFITSVLKCHPPKNRPPKKAWINSCLPHSEAQVALIRPKSILVLGQVALAGISSFKKLEEARMREFTWLGVPSFATYHPAAALRFPPLKDELRRDFHTFRTWLSKQGILP